MAEGVPAGRAGGEPAEGEEAEGPVQAVSEEGAADCCQLSSDLQGGRGYVAGMGVWREQPTAAWAGV